VVSIVVAHSSLHPSATLGSRDLIAGFKPKLMPRSDGRYDLNFTGPDGKRFRSMLDVGRFFNLAGDSKMLSSKKKATIKNTGSKAHSKSNPSNAREVENEKRKLRRELEKLTRAHDKATKALDDFETTKKEGRYPVDDDLLVEEDSDKQSVTPTTSSAALLPDFDGFPRVPPDCLPDLIMAWDFLCTFHRALSLNPIGLDDFAAALSYQPQPSDDEGVAPPVYVAEAHLGILKLLLQDRSSDEWWWSILETDEMQPGFDEEEAVASAMIDSKVPLLKIDMAALLADGEDPLITTSWLQMLEGVREQNATATKSIRKAVKDATALVTNKWVRAYLKKVLASWNGSSADFAKRAVIWLVDRMQEARPDLFGQAIKPDQLETLKAGVVEEAMAFMEKLGDDCIIVGKDEIEAESDDEMDSDESDDEDESGGNSNPSGPQRVSTEEAIDESSLPATSTLPVRPPPTLVDLLLPPAKPFPASDVVSPFTWPHLAGATVWRILHRYKRLRNEVDDSLRAQRELPPMTVGERRQREASVASRMFSECAVAESDPTEKAAKHLAAGGSYLDLTINERLCLLRLLIEAAYDADRVYEVVDDNFQSRIGAIKALEMEKRRAKREAKEEAAEAEKVAREKLAAEAKAKFLEEKREQIEKQNQKTFEYSDEFIEGLTDDDVLEFDEDTKAEYEALPGPVSFSKAEVNKMVVRVQEESAFNTDALAVLTMDEIVENEKLELKEMEEELATYGDVDPFTADRDTTKLMERLRRNISNMKEDASYLPSERQDAVNALHDAMQDGTIKALRAAIKQARNANLQGEDQETGGLWALDVLRDAALELKAAERRKRIIDAQKDLVQKRNKCFIRTEPIGFDRFQNRFWHFGNDEDGRVWAEADYIVKTGDAENGVPSGYVNLLETPSKIGVGAEEKEDDFVKPDLSDEEKKAFVRFSRQEFHKEGLVPLLAKRHWGCHSTEKSLRSMMKKLDGRGSRELELKANLKETLEESTLGAGHAELQKDSEKHDASAGTPSKMSAAENGTSSKEIEVGFRRNGDEEVFSAAKRSVKPDEENSVVSLAFVASLTSAIGQPVRVREIVEETRDRSVANYKLGKIDAWKMTQVEVEHDESEDAPMSTMIPVWRVTYEREGETWLSGDELLDSLCRYIRWKNKDKGYAEYDASYLAYRNSLGRHCGKASDASLASTPMFLARLMVKREQELYFTLKNRTFDNNWGGKSGTRNAWITTMKEYCYDFVTVRDGLLTLEQAFYELTGGAPDDGTQLTLDAKAILNDEKLLFETELESIEKTAEGLWNSRESRAVFQEIVKSAKTTGILALALDLLCRNCRAYLDRNKISEPRQSVAASQAPRTTRRMNAWQKSNEAWY
jgi:hypothetical protein